MDIRTSQLHPERYYHIFNRGVNGNKIFFEDNNYHYFLAQYSKYVSPYVETYAYCLLGNHFHLLIAVKGEQELLDTITKNKDKPLYWHVSNAFSSFLQGYTRAINKRYNRSGTLFEKPFKRIEMDDEDYFSALISYIHKNPEKHGIISDFRNYQYSSYQSYLSQAKTKLKRDEVLSWFGGKAPYQDFHSAEKAPKISREYLLE